MRPGPVQWLRYTFGGRLPPELQDWVRHDLTDADWLLREMVRLSVQIAVPVAAVFLLPGPLQIRVLTAILLAFGAVFTVVAFAPELRDRRLRQHGLSPPPRRR